MDTKDNKVVTFVIEVIFKFDGIIIIFYMKMKYFQLNFE